MKPLPQAGEAVRRAAAITGRACATRCTRDPDIPPSRCCGVEFCATVEAGLVLIGEPIPAKPNAHGIPFLGPDGCVVPPELRPGCAGYVCEEHISAGDSRDVARLMSFAMSDPVIHALGAVGAARSLAMLEREAARHGISVDELRALVALTKGNPDA